MLTKELDNWSCGRDEPLRPGEQDNPERTLMRNSECRGGVASSLVIDNGSATGIGQGVSENAGLPGAQAECRHSGRNRSWIDRNQPGCLGKSLSRRVGGSFALHFQDRCLRYHHGRPQLTQQVK
jgi:hypothetical protein